MGFSLVFNIMEAYSKEGNLMTTDDMNSDIDKVLEKVNDVIMANGGEVLGNDQIKMRICYPSISSDDITSGSNYFQNYKTEIFLFNTSENNVSHVLCRNKFSEEEFDVYVNEVDDHFLTISEKSRILNFRQTYTIEYTLSKIGDITFKVGYIAKDAFTRFPFLEMNNPYYSKFDEIKDFSLDVIQSLFFPNMWNYCLFDQVLDRLYRKDRLKTNNHWEFLQYVHYIFKK